MRNLQCCDRAVVSCCDVTLAQASTLSILQEMGTVTMNELATEMRLHGTTMTRMVDSLVDKGFVKRWQDPEDRRIVRVDLTPEGQVMTDRLQGSKRSFLAMAFAALSDEERDSILKALNRLNEVAEQLGSSCCAF